MPAGVPPRENVVAGYAGRSKSWPDITRWGRLPQVLRVLDAAQNCGLRSKINAVALKGFNEATAQHDRRGVPSAALIYVEEVMPMGESRERGSVGPVTVPQDVRRAYEDHYNVYPIAEKHWRACPFYVRLEETGQKIGFSRRRLSP